MYTGIYWDILVQALYRLVYTALYCVQTSIYKYRSVYTQIYFYVQDFDAHRGECQYRRMAEVMEQLDAARDELLDDDDERVGLVKDAKEVEKRLRHRLLPRNAWRLVPFFELFMSAPKDELHQWYIVCPFMYVLSFTCMNSVCTVIYLNELCKCKYMGLTYCCIQVSRPLW